MSVRQGTSAELLSAKKIIAESFSDSATFLFSELCVAVGHMLLVVHKEHRDAPYARQRDYDVNYSRDERCRAAADPCNKVEGEKTYQTPVESADYNECERDFVND